MARVHLARQRDLDRLVALKELSGLQASEPEFAQRFLRESRLASSLSHPNIVTVFDYLEWEGTPYISMEYLERGSLRRFMGMMTLAQAGAVLEGTLAGMAHAERRGIVHRDMKPENVLVTLEGGVKIADFGIAKATTEVQTEGFKTDTGTTLGTPGYMAPEQAMAQPLGPWTDLYSIGCMAYEMVVGHIPFHDSDTPIAMLLRHINEPVPPAREVTPDADPEISDWIDTLLSKDPSERPQSSREAWESFEEILIARLGHRWKRNAELPDVPATRGSPAATSEPWTPPPADAVAPAPEFLTFGTHTLEPPEAGPAPPSRGEEGAAYRTYLPPPPPRPPVEEPMPTGPQEPPASTPIEAPPPAGHSEPAAPVDVPPPASTPSAGAASAPEESSDPSVPPRAAGSGPAAPSGPSVDRRRRVLWAAVLGCAAVAAGVALVVILGSGDPETRPPPPPATGVALAAGPLGTRAPAGFEALDQPVALRNLRLRPAAAAAAAGRPASGVVILGLAGPDANTPLLLPPAFVKSLQLPSGEQPDREVVSAGPSGWKAYRYARLRPAGLDRDLRLYAWPTSAGVAIVACLAPVSTKRCDATASSFTARGLQAFEPGPDGQYAQAMDRILERLNRALQRSRREIRAARVRRTQAAAADSTASAFGQAAAELRRLRLSPADRAANAAMVRALLGARSGYRELAAATRRGERIAYRTAAGRAERAERDVETALSRLLAGGYAGLVSARFAATTVPGLSAADPEPPRPTPTPTPTPTATPTQTPTPTVTVIPPPPPPTPPVIPDGESGGETN